MKNCHHNKKNIYNFIFTIITPVTTKHDRMTDQSIMD